MGQFSPKFCHACGAQIDARAEICPRCGVRQAVAGPGKDRLVAAALALLLGGLGIHKFYLGRTALGVLYLLFCWTGIPSLIGWVEGISYLLRSNEAWAAEYGGLPARPNAAGLGCLWLVAIWPLLWIGAIVLLIFLGSQVNTILSRTGAALSSPTPIVSTQAPSQTLAVSTQEPSSIPSTSAVDPAKVSGLMAQLQASPNDTAILMGLGNEYYTAGQYDTAGQWFDKVLAIEPKNVDALLARGAISFNLGDLTAAEATWKQVVAIDPRNVEAHYDLGFLYLNLATPDWAGVQREWELVVQLAPGTQLAETVQQHLDSLAASSMLP